MISLRTCENPLVSVVILSYGNQEMLQQCLTSLSATVDEQVTPYEAVVLLQQAAEQNTRSLLAQCSGVQALHAALNLGFGAGNNFAACRAKGVFLVFVNDDATMGDGWLTALVAAASDEGIGAVGSRILFPNGVLQEAGAIVWSDGSCYPVGRGESSDSLTYAYARDVDHTSANGMLIRRSTFERAGGFDERFYPAYYEDVDLCLTLRHRLGLRVRYEPRSIIYHHESVTANRDPDFRSFLFERHRRLFFQKWKGELAYYPAAEPDSPVAVERALLRARGNQKRVLVLDDRVPEVGLGSGFGRTADMLQELSYAGYAVDFAPTNRRHMPMKNSLGHLGIDIVQEPLANHVARQEKRYRLVIISRPHNFSAYYKIVRDAMPHTPVIYDAEALYHRRLFLQAQLETSSARRDVIIAQAEAMQDVEIKITQSADAIVAISETESDWIENIHGHAPVTFMRPLARNIRMLPRNLKQRGGAVFVSGWLAGEQSPNVAGLRWYAEKVQPIICDALPHFVTYVSGAHPPLSVQCLESGALVLTGFAQSVESLYQPARVAISPILAGAGVKIKTIEAMQYGVPAVATTVGAEGLALTDGIEIDIADDPEQFAARIIALATDDALWQRRRECIENTVAVWESQRIRWDEVADNVVEKHKVSVR